MADCVENWCAAVRANDRTSPLLVLAGVFGCGKSEVLRRAHAFIKAIYMDVWPGAWSGPISTAFVEFPRFVEQVAEKKNDEYFEDVADADVAFIDDIGAEEDRFRSGIPARILGDLLGARERKFTLLTTNVEPGSWSQRWDPRVDDRLIRRNAVTCNLYDPEHAAVSYAQWQLQQP